MNNNRQELLKKLATLYSRLSRLGIKIELMFNSPWVYLKSVNGKRVVETSHSDVYFTIMFLPSRNDSPTPQFTNIKEIFKIIRKYR